MKKKVITTATTTILALGLLQGASTAYAGDFDQTIGGAGSGNIYSIDDESPSVETQVGNVAMMLSGILSNGTHTFNGEGSLSMTIAGDGPVRRSFTFNCSADPVGNSGVIVGLNVCNFGFEVPLPNDYSLASDGDCYINRNSNGRRELGCQFLLGFSVAGQGVDYVAPVFFPKIF